MSGPCWMGTFLRLQVLGGMETQGQSTEGGALDIKERLVPLYLDELGEADLGKRIMIGKLKTDKGLNRNTVRGGI